MLTQSSSTDSPVNVQVLVLRGGGGHYATFLALKAILAVQRPHWQLTPIFADRLGEAAQQTAGGRIADTLGSGSDQFYDTILKLGFGWIHLITVHIHKVLIRLRHRLDVRLLADIWQQRSPDLILSVVPFHNRALAESVKVAGLSVPVVTLMTDFADSPPSYWTAPYSSNYLLCPTDRAVQQTIQQGVPETHAIPTSGLVVHPQFYRSQATDIDQRRLELGLSPECMTGLLLFGANGSTAMIEIARQLAAFGNRLQLICLCGRNQAVRQAIEQLPSNQTRLTVGFTHEIADYMQLADFFIGKPGNVSISEALVMNLPVITERNWLTLPQERYAADWIEARQAGIVLPTFRQVNSAVETFLHPEEFEGFRMRVQQINNRACFEIPDILKQILDPDSTIDQTRPLVVSTPL